MVSYFLFLLISEMTMVGRVKDELTKFAIMF